MAISSDEVDGDVLPRLLESPHVERPSVLARQQVNHGGVLQFLLDDLGHEPTPRGGQVPDSIEASPEGQPVVGDLIGATVEAVDGGGDEERRALLVV